MIFAVVQCYCKDPVIDNRAFIILYSYWMEMKWNNRDRPETTTDTTPVKYTKS